MYKTISMGIFWDILQQEELEKQEKQTNDLESRVATLEQELQHTKQLLRKTLLALEEHISRDIDGDGKTG